MIDPETAQRLAAIEFRLGRIEAEMGIDASAQMTPSGRAAISEEVTRLMREGKVIEAFKAYRAETGASFEEAKAVLQGQPLGS